MALYVSRARRIRRAVIAGIAVAVLAALAGWAFGRSQLPSIDDRVADVRADAERIATDTTRLDIEYRQAVDAEGDDLRKGVLVPLRDERVALQETMDRAPWLRADRRAALVDAMVAAEQAATDQVPVDEFRNRLDAAAELIRQELG
jgi:hypothetical protein